MSEGAPAALSAQTAQTATAVQTQAAQAAQAALAAQTATAAQAALATQPNGLPNPGKTPDADVIIIKGLPAASTVTLGGGPWMATTADSGEPGGGAA